MKSNHRNAVLRVLKAGQTITHLQALSWFGCARLAARICELRKFGWLIDSTPKPLGDGSRIAEYSISKGNRKALK